MSNFATDISNLIETQLSQLKKELIDSGLDEAKVNKVFSNFGLREKVYTAKPKPYKIDHTKNKNDVVIVLNYGPKSHALFGDFQETYCDFKDEFLKKTKWMKYNKLLAFGCGWIMMNKDKLGELEKGLKDKGIKYKKMEREDYEKEIKQKKGIESEGQENSVSDSEGHDSEGEQGNSEGQGQGERYQEPEDSEEEQEQPVFTGKNKKESKKPVKKEENKKEETKKPVKKEENKKEETKKEPEKVVPKKPNTSKNDWGNQQDDKTGFIFRMLPIGGPKGKAVVIGTQDEEADNKTERGVVSVFRLSEEEIETCVKNGWRYLTQEIIDTVKKDKNAKSKALGSALQDILDQEYEESEENDIEESGGQEEKETEEQEPEEEQEKETKGKKNDTAIYYMMNVPCNADDGEDSEEEEEKVIKIPCKFRNKEALKKLRETLKNDDSDDFFELCDRLNEWVENVDGVQCVADTPSLSKKLSGKEKKKYLEFK